jgi:hypothetical protein
MRSTLQLELEQYTNSNSAIKLNYTSKLLSIKIKKLLSVNKSRTSGDIYNSNLKTKMTA